MHDVIDSNNILSCTKQSMVYMSISSKQMDFVSFIKHHGVNSHIEGYNWVLHKAQTRITQVAYNNIYMFVGELS